MDGIYKDLYVTHKEPLVIEVSEGSNAIPLVFTVQDWSVPGSANVNLYIEKPSGSLIYDAGTIDGQDITVEMTTQMTAETGISKCQLTVIDGTDVLNTFVFYLKVFESIIDSSAIQSTDEFTALETALAEVADVVTHDELASVGSDTQPVYFDSSGLPTAVSGTVVKLTDLASTGSETQGVYFDSDGAPQAMTYSVSSTVPACPVLVLTTPTISSLPVTLTDDYITANHTLVYATLADPTVQIADWTVTTAAGSLTISGSINGSTTAVLTFVANAVASTAS